MEKQNRTITGYKFIQSNMMSKNGEHRWEIGKWYKLDEDKIELCKYGFHACLEPYETLDFIYGDKFFIVEARGKIINDKGFKFVASEMRLVKELPTSQIFKRFAIWNAKQCLNNYEKVFPNDTRISDCIKASENYLDGKINLDELKLAESVARSASRSAARSAAWSAESAAWSARSAANKYLKKLIKKYNRNTSENIKSLSKEEIFVFGSNLAGRHNGGAAKLAHDKFKAEYGIGEGLTGKSYALPTLDEDFSKLELKEIKKSVNKLNKCARENPFKIFLLTKVGCGIAGYKEEEIKKLFKNTELNIIKPKSW